MNVHLLIDAIVRQTTILLAQLATSSGSRAALGHTANQVFLDLAGELRQQGLSNTLIADMFGLSLRTYHNKVKRLSESRTDRGRPLWNAVLDFVQSQGSVARAEVLMRFCRDDAATVKSVLNDLVETGAVFAKGRGDSVAYRAASLAEYDIGQPGLGGEAKANLVWIVIARHSPISRSRLLELTQLDVGELDVAIDNLLGAGRVERCAGSQDTEYSSRECVIALGEAGGWEAAVFDHYQAVVAAICAKLNTDRTRAERGEWIGGSTYSYEVWPGHPLHDEAVNLLQHVRDRAAELRSRIDVVNETLARPANGVRRVIAYVGQNVIDTDDAMETEHEIR